MNLNVSAFEIENILFNSSYQHQPVAGYIFTNATVTPRAILQISHGMAEYLLRYRAFAEFLTQHGFVVCGNDHLGHGATSGTAAQDGFFAPKNGEEFVLQDLLQMNKIIRKRYPSLPLVLFGHSMGSFFARWFVERFPTQVDGVIICGTGGSNPIGGVGIAITALLTKLKGATATSNFVDQLAFGSYNKRIEAQKTKFDWLSKNDENVAQYIADPKCGFLFTVSAFHALMVVLQQVNTSKHYTLLPKELPYYVIAGENDPVGNYGKGPTEVATRLQQQNIAQVSLTLYPEMRHEILNEKDATKVFQDVLEWCETAILK